MKQILQNFKTGELAVHDVPEPILRPHGVLVRTHYSLISAGTEGGTVRLAKKNLMQKALSRPDLVKKVVKVAQNDGVLAAYDAVRSNLDSPVPLGYSLSGEVVAVGSDITDLAVGDRVACFGSMVANHAALNFIPRNMCVRLPDDSDMRHAAFCMVGAIALNGIRRAQVELGSAVLVIGLGLIGQLAVQLLKASGCRVFGVDLDPTKNEQAITSGADVAMLRSEAHVEEAIHAFSNGLGVDAVIITAATDSTDPIELAGRVTRMRGRVVALGRVPYELPRDTYLFKEIDFITTLAFGPGVNDPNYEERGIDYPAAFVRWSGNRNIQAFTQLAYDERLQLDPLITHEYDIDDAKHAFSLLTGENDEMSIAILLRYDVSSPYTRQSIRLSASSSRRGRTDTPGIGVIGAGSHAVSFMFDAIAAQPVHLRGLMSAGGFKGKWYGDKYHFDYVANDSDDLFNDEQIDAVFILSRHNSHGRLTVRAMEAGKDVFVEKPLCLTEDELDAIIAAQRATGSRLMVGYNRRYAPMGRKLYARFHNHAQPLTVNYRANIGFRPANHWLHDLNVGGGLILGEAVHFIDFAQYLVDAVPQRVYAQSIHSATNDIIDGDTVTINVTYNDGSMSSIHYLSTGDTALGRERIEVYGDNQLGILEDWRSLVISKGGKRDKTRHMRQDKGFHTEVGHFIDALRHDKPLDMTFESIVYGMRVAFGALASLRTQQVVELNRVRETGLE